MGLEKRKCQINIFQKDMKFRNIKQNEAEEAAEIERICFSANEACF
mgnify:CR=1 FL=1